MTISSIAGLPTGYVVDALARMGRKGWIADLLPRSSTVKFTGHARTLRYAAPGETADPVRTNMYAVMRSLEAGEVLVVATGGAPCWFMGENMIHEALYSGLGAVVTDGRIRDSAEIRDIAVPVFSAGISVVPPLEAYVIAELDGPVSVGGARIARGDILHGDADGVVTVARELQEEVEKIVAELAEVEATQERAIRERVPLAQLQAILALKKGVKPKHP